MSGVTGASLRAYGASFGVSVARGDQPGWGYIDKFGRNPDVDTAGVPADIWEGGGLYSGQPLSTTPEPVQIFSSSADDSTAGIGLQAIRVIGLKSHLDVEYVSEDFELQGLTPGVVSISTWYRVNRIIGIRWGSGEVQVGSITVRHSVTVANVFAVIAPPAAQTSIGAWTVPFRTTLYVMDVILQLSRAQGLAGSANVVLAVREFGSGGYRYIRNFEITTAYAVASSFNFPIVISSQADIVWRVVSVSDNNSILGVQMDGFTVKDPA